VIGFPLLLVPFAIYNMIAFLTPLDWTYTPYTFPLMSGVQWGPSVSDAFIVFSLLMMMFEVIKSTRHGKSIVEHFLGLLLAGGAGTEFVMVSQAGNSTFMLFVAICVVDLFAGFAASLRRARRVVAVETIVPVAPAAPPPVVRAEPVTRVEPAAKIGPNTPAEPRSDPFVTVTPAEKI
jgi:hypothetical protein